MPRVSFFHCGNGEVLDELEASAITPGARQRISIGGGGSIPGRAELATISIALSAAVLTAVMTAQRNDRFGIVTEAREMYRLVGWQIAGIVLHGELEFLGIAPSPA